MSQLHSGLKNPQRKHAITQTRTQMIHAPLIQTSTCAQQTDSAKK